MPTIFQMDGTAAAVSRHRGFAPGDIRYIRVYFVTVEWGNEWGW